VVASEADFMQAFFPFEDTVDRGLSILNKVFGKSKPLCRGWRQRHPFQWDLQELCTVDYL
jgi:hypothetical protein